MQICHRSLFTEQPAGMPPVMSATRDMACAGAARWQRGVILIEAMVGILIFTIGVFAVMGLQAVSVKNSLEAKNRTDAAMLANSLISRMSVDNKSFATLQANYNSPGGAVYTQWLADVQNLMPGVAGVPANQPTVVVAPVFSSGLNATQVVVRVFWQVPGQDVHNFTALSQINCTVTDEKNSACAW